MKSLALAILVAVISAEPDVICDPEDDAVDYQELRSEPSVTDAASCGTMCASIAESEENAAKDMCCSAIMEGDLFFSCPLFSSDATDE